MNFRLLNLTNLGFLCRTSNFMPWWKSWPLPSTWVISLLCESEHALMFLYYNWTCNTNKRFVATFSLGNFLLVVAHAVSIVSINYISGISPIWFLFLTKPKPVCSYGNNFPPSSFRIILNLFAHGIYQVRGIIWQMSLSRTGLWVWTSLQESWPLISVLSFTPYIIVDKPCNFYKLQNCWP